jgi:integrase
MASVKLRKPNVYDITVSGGYASDGRKLRYYKTLVLSEKLTEKQKKKELDRLVYQFEEEVKNGRILDGSRMDFQDCVILWKKNHALIHLQPKTLFRYEKLLERIIPAIGHIKATELKPTHLMEFYSGLKSKNVRSILTYKAKDKLLDIMKVRNIDIEELAERAKLYRKTVNQIVKGGNTSKAKSIADALGVKISEIFVPAESEKPLSGTTILHYHRLICAILNCAVQWQIIESNPAERVKPPKADKKETNHFNEEEVSRMLQLLDEEPIQYKCMIYIALFSGCRSGELTGLSWDDIDFENNKLRIERATQYIPGRGVFVKEPKNKSSRRIITMPEIAMAVLREYKASQDELKNFLSPDESLRKDNEIDFIFAQLGGLPIFPSTPSNWFRKFLRKNGLPQVPFHGLRHTNASILISENVDLQTVAKRLGHTKPTTTTSIYSHFLEKPDRGAADILDNVFKGKKDQ